MRFWNDMTDKYGFGDGSSIPAEAFLCREVYVDAVNALAAHKGSQARCVCYDRPGMHNGCMILRIPLEQFATLSCGQVKAGEPLPDTLIEAAADDAWIEALADAEELQLDDFVIVEPELDARLGELVAELRQKGESFVIPAGSAAADSPSKARFCFDAANASGDFEIRRDAYGLQIVDLTSGAGGTVIGVVDCFRASADRCELLPSFALVAFDDRGESLVAVGYFADTIRIDPAYAVQEIAAARGWPVCLHRKMENS